MTPSSDDRDDDLDDDGWGGSDPDAAAAEAAERSELGEAAAALRARIRSPELDAHPIPQEVTLHMVANLLERIGVAGSTPTTDQRRAVVGAALEIARHVRRTTPSS